MIIVYEAFLCLFIYSETEWEKVFKKSTSNVFKKILRPTWLRSLSYIQKFSSYFWDSTYFTYTVHCSWESFLEDTYTDDRFISGVPKSTSCLIYTHPSWLSILAFNMLCFPHTSTNTEFMHFNSNRLPTNTVYLDSIFCIFITILPALVYRMFCGQKWELSILKLCHCGFNTFCCTNLKTSIGSLNNSFVADI